MTRAEMLAKDFYAWERWGRGCFVADHPVSIEPPFKPFFYHVDQPPAVDDGRKPTFLSALAERYLGKPAHVQEALPAPRKFDLAPRRIFLPEKRSESVELQIALPPQFHASSETFERFLLSLAYCAHALAFEIVGVKNVIGVQMAVDENDEAAVVQQLNAHFPDAVVNRVAAGLANAWNDSTGGELVVLECGLAKEFMLPLQIQKNFGNDPLVALVGALSELQKNEVAVFQVLFKQVRNPWPESILRAVTDNDGSPLFSNAPELTSRARVKVSKPLYSAVARLAGRAETQGRLLSILKGMAGALVQFSDPFGNELIPLKNDGYDSLAHEEDLLRRQSRRCGMLLNSDELISLVHWPAPAVREEKLVRSVRKTKAAPDLALHHSLLLGENLHAGEVKIVTQAPAQRVRHTHVIGASGTGKSTFLLNLILQDVEAGGGLAVLDPHGDLIEEILGRIPESRADDVILFDPADEEYPVGFNILSAHSTLEKNLLASDLGAVFRRLSTSWGDQMTSILGNAILAFLESTRGGTLSDLRRFLIEPGFRAEFLETVTDPEVVYYWKKEFPLLSGRPQASILTRLDTFLRPKAIRHIVAQKENRLDFAAMMNTHKIFLAKLSQGLLGVENAHLLGSLLVSKFHQLAIGRQEMAESSRENFWLYIDEFQNFVTPSMAAILSGARKYKLGLVLAHQELHQLESRDKDVSSAVLANAYTRICFRLGDADARKMAEGFSTFDAKDLQSLGTGEAICRIERSGFDFNLQTLPLASIDSAEAEKRENQIIDLSRQKYATSREEVETTLRQNTESTGVSIVGRGQAARAAPQAETAKMPLAEPLAPKPVVAGKGGQQHKLLQALVKQWAESRGFRTTIEKALDGGAGSVDVALEKDTLSIACEISVTSSVEYELGNLEKCLAAGYGFVLMIGTEEEQLHKLREKASAAVEGGSLERVRFLTPAEAFTFIQSLEQESGANQSRGYAIEFKSRELLDGPADARQTQIGEVLNLVVKRFNKR